MRAESTIMNSAKDHEPRTARFSGAIPQTCFVCGDPVGEQCFCRIHREDEGPIMLYCPDCTIQYLDSARVPFAPLEPELRACENSTHFLIGEHRPWS